jgi:hypothetical protein
MLASAAMALAIASAHAQVTDSSRTGIVPVPTLDTLPSNLTAAIPKPPVSPTSALFRSLLIPGWGQASLDRGTAGAIFAGVEVMSLAMLSQSKAELRAAERVAGDSIYQPGSNTFVANPLAQVVGKRQAAVEDWTVLLIFNHLISAADAFVAAHLWNVPVQVHGSPKQLKATATLRW